ncbi:uncharacterized protein LOC62_04G005359 [Vanrija pseudolonga]|uniref:Uncharacterized protein n=1 Tax=Vanrija pseudolonga TaxID=143232 RepID=A0AAF0YCB2_9TREE|nr:hypothetical protein LOC62_04G005359 [Vanrija pseudolonga]
MDAIIAHATIPALARLRATSREFHDRINRLLLHHVSLHEWPLGRRKKELGFTTPAHITFPGADTHPRLPFAPGAVEILDVITPPKPMPTTKVVDQFTRLKTLRRIRNDAVVTTGTNIFRPNATSVDLLSLDSVPNRDTLNIRLPPGVERYVFHMKWDEMGPSALWTTINMRSALRIVDWVLVLHPTNPGNMPPAPAPDFFTFLDVMTEAITIVERGGSVTVVGVERVSPAQMPNNTLEGRGTAAYEPLRENLRAHFLDHTPDPALVRAAVDAIRFVPYDEWLEELGDRKEAEGLWPEDTNGA